MNSFIRFRSLGEDFTEENLKKVIAGEKESPERNEKVPDRKEAKPEKRKFDLVVDIQEKMAQGKNGGYVQWAKKYNVKQFAESILFLQQHDIHDKRDKNQRKVDEVDTLLVSVMHANNETGVIQPVKELGELLADKGILFHIDATQSCGKLVPELREIKYNMLSLSAHKLSGPQGVGALVLRKKRYKLPPVKAVTYGGQQEHGIRPGTIPVALVAGLGEACRLAETEYEQNIAAYKEKKDAVLELIEKSGIKYEINGNQDYCMPNTINLSITGVESEALMLSSKQFCGISNGSACTSHEYSPSYVLTAMGLDADRISSAIRISWGAHTDKDELINELSELIAVAKSLVF